MTATTCSSLKRSTPWGTATRLACDGPTGRLERTATITGCSSRGVCDRPQPQPPGGGLRRARAGGRGRPARARPSEHLDHGSTGFNLRPLGRRGSARLRRRPASADPVTLLGRVTSSPIVLRFLMAPTHAGHAGRRAAEHPLSRRTNPWAQGDARRRPVRPVQAPSCRSRHTISPGRCRAARSRRKVLAEAGPPCRGAAPAVV